MEVALLGNPKTIGVLLIGVSFVCGQSGFGLKDAAS
jgi:hypothetical protein